jgi:hypothetical protein
MNAGGPHFDGEGPDPEDGYIDPRFHPPRPPIPTACRFDRNVAVIRAVREIIPDADEGVIRELYGRYRDVA